MWLKSTLGRNRPDSNKSLQVSGGRSSTVCAAPEYIHMFYKPPQTM
jgi:hypothetical protein